ncbi:hypothetical protein OPQ81_007157 [Rhizoctonia solani]|nr:hypothetical protein OPQ81_007157 [Rhizoctonia solani]
MPPSFNAYGHEGCTHQHQQSQGGRVDQGVARPDPRGPYAPLTPVTPPGTGNTGAPHINQTWSQGPH